MTLGGQTIMMVCQDKPCITAQCQRREYPEASSVDASAPEFQDYSDETLTQAKESWRAALKDLSAEYDEPSQQDPWLVGYSGGKDSSLLLQLVFEMLLKKAPSERRRPVHVITNDTLVESPVVISYVKKMMEQLQAAAESLRLPITVKSTTPPSDQTFWVNLIGRGYPAPNRSFRWCTDRLKIQPTSDYIRSQVAANGEVILLLGVRRDESATRSGSINRHQNTIRGRLNPHSDLKGCLVYRPISDFTTPMVWALLKQRPPPWGGNHDKLITLYRNAQGGECPLVIDKSQAPSCGTGSSRFGCWTCTVVEKDRSMEGFIETYEELNLAPLMAFRDELVKGRNDRSRRMAERRNGQVMFKKRKEPPAGTDGAEEDKDEDRILGPYTLLARKEMLDQLLALQREVQMPLIAEEEVRHIKRIWAEDAVAIGNRLLKNYLPVVTEGR